LKRVERLSLPDVSAHPLLARLPDLVALEVNGTELDHLPPRLVELTLRAFSDRSLASLARHPVAAGMKRLRLNGGRINADASALAALPKLTSLAFADVSFGKYGDPDSEVATIRTLTSRRMPALRELGGSYHDRIDSTREFVMAYGAQLESFTICRSRWWTLPGELSAKVAGEVRDGEWQTQLPMLYVGGRAPEPWLDPPLVLPTP
jgi:hypothetical protein